MADYSGRVPDGGGRRAVFSSIEALLAKAGTHSEAKGKRSRAEWFALFAVCGELGAVLGPVAGALLTGLAFAGGAGGRWRLSRCAGGSLLLPARVTPRCADAEARSRWTTFRQPRFVAFIIAYSSWLLSYNQLYLALPVEIQRSGSNEKDLGPLLCWPLY